jgi:uncharacterized protein (UPF0297 family)
VTKNKTLVPRSTRARRGGKKKRVRTQRGARKPSRKKNGTQLNAVVSSSIFNDFADHCRKRDLKRDRTLEAVLRRYLRAEEVDDDKEFHVVLSEGEARRFRAFRRVRQMPERSLVVEDALRRYIEQNLVDPIERSEFQALLADLHRGEPN